MGTHVDSPAINWRLRSPQPPRHLVRGVLAALAVAFGLLAMHGFGTHGLGHGSHADPPLPTAPLAFAEPGVGAHHGPQTPAAESSDARSPAAASQSAGQPILGELAMVAACVVVLLLMTPWGLPQVRLMASRPRRVVRGWISSTSTRPDGAPPSLHTLCISRT